MNSNPLEYYMTLPYRIDIYPEPNGSGYTAAIPELPGCLTSADTFADLWEMVEEAKRLWLEVALEEEMFIPEPAPAEEKQFSGKFVVRLPASLHRQLATRADAESTSLNQLVVMLLSDGMGRWQQERTLTKEYARFVAQYPLEQARNLTAIYSLLSTHAASLPPPRLEALHAWDLSDLQFLPKQKVRAVRRG